MLRANTKFFCSDRDEPEILAIGTWKLGIALQHFDNSFDINKPAATNLRK